MRPLYLPGHRRAINLSYLKQFPNDTRLSSAGLPKSNETWQAIAVEKQFGIRLHPILGTDGLDFESGSGRTVFEMITSPLATDDPRPAHISEENYLRWRDGTFARHVAKASHFYNSMLVIDVEGLEPQWLEETAAIARAALGHRRVLLYDGEGRPISCATMLEMSGAR